MDINTAKCSLAELVQDPLVGLVVGSDGVDRGEIELLLERVTRERVGSAERADIPVFPSPLPTAGTAR